MDDADQQDPVIPFIPMTKEELTGSSYPKAAVVGGTPKVVVEGGPITGTKPTQRENASEQVSDDELDPFCQTMDLNEGDDDDDAEMKLLKKPDAIFVTQLVKDLGGGRNTVREV